MTAELTLEQKYDWLRQTLEHLSSLPALSDDDFGYVVFELLDVDVTSCLHEVSLDPLVQAGRLSGPTKDALVGVRSDFLALVESARAARPIPEIRRDERWLAISRRCSQIVSDLHEETA